ncbi:MAG TPA: hypothetical protein VKH18_00180 [Terriglobales bacterium]|nr:hypothetical protein [Terriglobales bacterium]
MATATQLVEELRSHTTASVLHPSAYPTARDSQKRKRLRSVITRPFRRPQRVELERACRIALMEKEGPASVEIIYDRIVRRGSLMFLSYKRPFRAITLAMGALVKLGQASLLKTGRQRRWQR